MKPNSKPAEAQDSEISERSSEVDYGPLADAIGFNLRRAQNASFQAFYQRTEKFDLSPGHFAMLMIISRNPGINQSVLSRSIGRDKSTLTFSINSLIGRNLIERKRSDIDKRAFTLQLTKEGECCLEELSAHAEAHDALLDSIVGETIKPLFLETLKRITEELESSRGG